MEIEIEGQLYEIVDVLSNITIVDSAVTSKHKIGSAHGEREIYLCGNVEERERFFDGFSTTIEGFVWRENLLEYLKTAKEEYKNPRQEYREKMNMPMEYEELIEDIEKNLKF